MQNETNNKANKRKTIPVLLESLLITIGILLMVLTLSIQWINLNFGNITIDEIIFHISMPLKGTSERNINSYFSHVINGMSPYVALIAFIYAVCWVAKKRGSGGELRILSIKNFIVRYIWIFYCIWVVFLFNEADRSFELRQWIESRLTESTFIANEYVDPNDTEIIFPGEKRNLICIFVESAETTNQNIENGGIWHENYVVEMTNLAKQNVSFSQSNTLEGAAVAPACGWTIAGLVAETSGLPLKLYSYNDSLVDNSMGKYEYFLPGATTLGDILEQEGYINYFMAGSDFTFGGKTKYFVGHGNYQIFDYFTAIEEGKIPSDYYEWWGFEDAKLYEYAKEKITELANGDQPFNFSMLTVDTHQEDGYVCDLCKNEYDNQYANVWRCASRQLDSFIKWVQEQSFYENTTIVIVGDHCSMDSDFYDIWSDKHHGSVERKIYNCFINSAIDTEYMKNRQFTTMDMFPTILASLGVSIDGDRLGLGTNLFSGTPTLAEEYGYETLFKELDCKSTFYNQELLFK